MGKKNKGKISPSSAPVKGGNSRAGKAGKSSYIPWLVLAMAITAICLSPMLSNGFTNWDDEFYVVKNSLLRGPDWAGIFSKPVVGNYHPLTIATLALNFSLSGLDASSYLLFNYLSHLLNTALVFYFIWKISGKNYKVAFFTSLLFGIHPMHVESVAWVSERKDVLYTFFFLISLLQYWNYLQNGKRKWLWYSFFFFVLSILSKPAAIILPFVLLLLDYWKGRAINRKVIIEKIPFFLLGLLFAVITLKIQSTTAVVKLESYPLWSRPLFACYVYMIYLIRFIIPYPLSTFHPFPPVENLGLPILLSPIFIIAIAGIIWYNRKNKLLVFGSLFFFVNLLLVAQIVSIGSSLVSERYTYVPYIGIAFIVGMWLDKFKTPSAKTIFWISTVAITSIFGYISFGQTSVWKNSDTLWTNVIKYYPDAAIPRTNRANYYISRATDPANQEIPAPSLYQLALDDCNAALLAKPDDEEALANRQNIYLNLNSDSLAMADANNLAKLKPENKASYYTRSVIYARNNRADLALKEINLFLSKDSTLDFGYAQRAFILFNQPYQDYDATISDYTRAIEINPIGSYYLNRSYCYFRKNDLIKAKADAVSAVEKGTPVSAEYRKTINF